MSEPTASSGTQPPASSSPSAPGPSGQSSPDQPSQALPSAAPLGLAGRIARAFINTPVTPMLLIGALCIGVLGLLFTPRQEDPQISVPMIDIFVSYPGASTRQVETLVTDPLERLMKELPGVRHVYSATMRSAAIVTVRFYVGEDLGESIVKVHDRIASNMDRMPPNVEMPLVKPVAVDDVPVVTLTLWSEDVGDHQLRKLGLDVLQSLGTLDGVGKGFVVGGQEDQIRVEVQMERLAGYGISLDRIARTIQTANAELATGATESGGTAYNVYSGSFLRHADDVSRLVVGSSGGYPIYVRDVATVRRVPEDTKRLVTHATGPAYEGPHPTGATTAVTVAIAKQEGTNGVTVARAVLEKLEELKGKLIPTNVHVEVTRNYGKTANDKVNELLQAMFEAAAIVAVLCLIGLGTRAAFVVITVIPVVILLTIWWAWMVDYTIDRVSLFALIFAIGILVDDATVVVENIFRHWLEIGETSIDAAVRAVDEVGNPTILATFTIIAALLPMGWVSGLMGAVHAADTGARVVRDVLQPGGGVRLHALVCAAGAPAAQGAGALGAARGAHPRRGRALLPAVGDATDPAPWARQAVPGEHHRRDRRRLSALLHPDGAGEDAALRQQAGVQRHRQPAGGHRAAGDGQRAATPREGGAQDAGREGGADLRRGRPAVQLQRHGAPLLSAGAALGRGSARDAGGQAQAGPRQPRHRHRGAPVVDPAGGGAWRPHRRGGDATGAAGAPDRCGGGLRPERRDPPPGCAGDLTEIFEQADGVVDVDNYLTEPYSYWRFEVDAEKAVRYGVSVDTINQNLAMAMGGHKLGDVKRGRSQEPTWIVLQVPLASRADINGLTSLPISTQDGRMLPLGELGRFTLRPEEPVVYHKDLRPMEYVVGEMEGRLGAPIYGMLNIEALLEEYRAPDGVTISGMPGGLIGPPSTDSRSGFEWTGEWTVTYETFRDMGLAFMAALVLIYGLIVWEFRNFKLAGLIMSPIPLTLIGIIPGHLIMGAEFTATSMIGLIALGGIIVRQSILIVEFVKLEVAKGQPVREAAVRGAEIRMRPILITSLTLMAGAWAIIYDPIFQGMAVSLLFGAGVATLMAVIVIPLGCITLRREFYRVETAGGDTALSPDFARIELGEGDGAKP